MYISIERCGETQTRKLVKEITVDRAKDVLRNLRDDDELGCDVWSLWDDKDNEILTLYPHVEEKFYGASNPWDAPGMSVKDFI